MPEKLLIYHHTHSERIKYTFKLFFNTLIQTTYELTDNQDSFIKYQGPKINYSTCKLTEDELYFAATNFLDENSIINFHPEFVSQCNGFFPIEDPSSILPFDPFAACFYLASRYEEYLPFKKDAHQRFASTESLLSKYKMLEQPIINIWAEEIKKIISSKYPQVVFKENKFQYLSTIDVDIAYSYKGKSIFRFLINFFSSILKLNFKQVIYMLSVRFGNTNDPYDTFGEFVKVNRQNELLFFFHMGDYGIYDKSIPYKHPLMTNLIKKIKSK